MVTELKAFDSLGKEWWNPDGRLASLHKINPLRFNYFTASMGEVSGKRILDIGCGGGLLSEEFAKTGASVTGIDLSPVAIDAAKAHAKKSGLEIEYMLIPVSQLSSHGSQPYDAIICAEVLEHVDDLDTFLKDCSSLLKNGGFFLFSTINRTLAARFFAIFVAETLRMVPKGTHDYSRFIRPSALVNLLKKNNITVQEIKGMTFDPLRSEFKLSESTNINYLGFGTKTV